MDCYIHCTQLRYLLVLWLLFILEFYIAVFVYNNAPQSTRKFYRIINPGTYVRNNQIMLYYKYPLINSMEIAMDYVHGYNSSYHWFMKMKYAFKKLGEEDILKYPKDTPICKLNETSLGPIKVNRTVPQLEWIAKYNPDVRLGGYYAPAHCRSPHRVAVIVPYRNRRKNLGVFLRYLHPLLKKQLLQYRIFVIEQYGTEKFNKGTLYNIAFLETQRFGTWHCLIFHDVDLIPEDERISYSCPEHPTHMSPNVQSLGYEIILGGVTALTPEHYTAVNGYSNIYGIWDAEDLDFCIRLLSNNYNVLQYNSSIARYASLPHKESEIEDKRTLLLIMSKLRPEKEGLTTTKYNLVGVTEEKLFTHILADINPTRMKLDTKSLMQSIVENKNFNYLAQPRSRLL